MINFTDYINEKKGDNIDDDWLNSKKSVMTKDGREVKILNIDYSQVPNIISGQVNDNDNLLDYQWKDTGICIKSQDKYGNPKMPDDNDILVKEN